MVYFRMGGVGNSIMNDTGTDMYTYSQLEMLKEWSHIDTIEWWNKSVHRSENIVECVPDIGKEK